MSIYFRYISGLFIYLFILACVNFMLFNNGTFIEKGIDPSSSHCLFLFIYFIPVLDEIAEKI